MPSKNHLRVTTELLTDEAGFQHLVEIIRDSEVGLHLDLSGFDLEGGQRLAPINLLLLSNLFLGAAAKTPVTVTLPSTDAARLAAMRSGLLFSLLGRSADPSSTEVILPGVSPGALNKWIELWTEPWSPREPAVGRLFDDEPRVVDSRDYAGAGRVINNPNNAKRATRVVVDPHRRSRQFLHVQASQGLARRWLRLVTPTSRDIALTNQRETWMSIVSGRILTEPLLNLADHAIKRPPELPSRPHIKSLALLARTDGGRDSHPRLQLLVADSGYGIVNTLRPKLERSGLRAERQVAEKSAIEILEFTVTRPATTAKDPGLPWARAGFEVAVSEAAGVGAAHDGDLDAEFTVITSDPDCEDAAIWVTVARDRQVTRERRTTLPFVGTTVFVTLPMPRPGVHQEVGPSEGAFAGARR